MSPSNDDPHYPILEKLGFMNMNHVKIKNPKSVEESISTLVNNGFDKLQVIADYDRTITPHSYNGKLEPSSFGILDNSPLMPTFYRTESDELLKKYYPIEIDPKLTEEEKIPQMVEWYTHVQQLLIKCNFKQSSIKEMVASSNARLRDGTEDLFLSLFDQNVPILIFSAGMGDVLEQTLQHFSIYNDNVKVVSNFFKYDNQDLMVGFQNDLIHTYNKKTAVPTEYFYKLKTRSNVILMGDSLGDIQMSHSVPHTSNILRIGFLNDKITERLEQYMNAYDIVLIDDQTMKIPQAILKLMPNP